jgi:hypothetical protein
MLKLRNPFKRRKKKTAPEEFKSIGEIAWKSINLENEPNIEQKMEVV